MSRRDSTTFSTAAAVMERGRRYSVSDVYFYSELSKSVGSKASDEWLQGSVQYRASSSISLPTSPVHSFSPSSLVSMVSLKQLNQNYTNGPDKEECAEFYSEQQSSDGSSGRVEGRIRSNAEISRLTSKLGLLFTDAAHSVLDDGDFAVLARGRWMSLGSSSL